MTHEELLAKIDAQIAISYAGSGFSEFASRGTMVEAALRAVVELHKPKVKPETHNDLLCEECARQCTGNGHMFYPCPTIQAIERELA